MAKKKTRVKLLKAKSKPRRGVPKTRKAKSKTRRGAPKTRRGGVLAARRKAAPPKVARKPVRPKVKASAGKGKVVARHDAPRPGETKVGTVEHYYTKIGVFGMTLKKPLKVGDSIRVAGHTSDFTEKVESMQINHASVTEAKAGDSIGMKVIERAREGDTVFRVGS